MTVPTDSLGGLRHSPMISPNARKIFPRIDYGVRLISYVDADDVVRYVVPMVQNAGCRFGRRHVPNVGLGETRHRLLEMSVSAMLGLAGSNSATVRR